MKRGIHKGLTPAKILEESFAMVDAGGPAALTMRGLARRLDVAAMAIYNHYADRDAILDALSERVFAELAREHLRKPAVRSSEKWKEKLRAIIFGAHQLAARHPHIYRLAMTRPKKPAAAFELTAEAMSILQSAGLTEDKATTVYHTFLILLHGFPFWREGFELHLGDCTGKSAETAERQFANSVEWLLNAIEP